MAKEFSSSYKPAVVPAYCERFSFIIAADPMGALLNCLGYSHSIQVDTLCQGDSIGDLCIRWNVIFDGVAFAALSKLHLSGEVK